MTIPTHGRASAEILAELGTRAEGDTNWKGGRVFSLVYAIPGEQGAEHAQLLERAHAMYASTNLLNPMAFPSLKQMETEIIANAGELFHCRGAVGTVTSGGTESILCAVAAYRDRARREKPWIRRPELVVPMTLHPAFDKAAHYFGVKLVKVPVGDDLRADVVGMRKAIGRRTIGIVASAPQYPHGVVDPIGDLGELAMEKNLPLHVDACVGGFILPWLEKLGRRIPRWDFRVPGVTSISADLHKFGYAAKGASVLIWRSLEAMKHQFFVVTDFPGGIYASPTLIGTRPGGPIAAAWAAQQSLGAEGYLALAQQAVDASDRLRNGIKRIAGLKLTGESDSTIVAYETTDKTNIFAIADRLEARGWTVDRMHRPNALHLTVTANHGPIVDEYLADLAAAVAEVKKDPKLAKSGSAPMYGMAATMPVRFLVASRVRDVFAKLYSGVTS
jgi:glutamate/tyrosine decarboxylase-like PLP-dependent enzyme